MPAVVLDYWAFPGTVLQHLKCFPLCVCLCIIRVGSIINLLVQYPVSWVPRLTLSDLQETRTHECVLGTDLNLLGTPR